MGSYNEKNANVRDRAAGRGGTMEVRQEIGRRLRVEMDRKGLLAPDLVDLARLSPDCISGYLHGRKEILFRELEPICSALNIPIMRLLTQSDPSPARIAYRKTLQADRKTVAKSENVFLWIEEFLPRFRSPSVPLPNIGATTDAQMLIAEVKGFIDRLKSRNPSLEYWYETLGIALAGSRQEGRTSIAQKPDGLCLSDNEHTLVLVNTDCPDVRLQFTLLHELWHAICDRGRDVPADHLPREFYDEALSEDARPEFCANKFAQFWTIPFETAEGLARKMNRLSGLTQQDVEEALQDTGGSPEVLGNAVYDALRYMGGRQKTFASIRDEIRTLAVNWSGNQSTRIFVASETRKLRETLQTQREVFGDHAWAAIESVIS